MSHLESGSVVWVRLGQAWWPGTITTVAKCPPEFVEGIRKIPIAIVKFFHENEFQDVHKSEHICPYNCDRKEEFIRRGQYTNKNQSHGEVDLLAKFEADVVTAEKLTGGDMNILQTLGEVAGKRRIDYSDLGFGAPKPKKRKDVVIKIGSDIGQAVVYKKVGSRNVGNKLQRVVIEHKVQILEQPKRKNVEEDMRGAANWFKCYTCGFTCSRLNVIVWHNKAHIKKVFNYDTGIKIPGRRKRKQGTPKSNKEIKRKAKESKSKDNMEHAHTNGEVLGSKKDVQDTQQLLMDWVDDDEGVDGETFETLPRGLDKDKKRSDSDDGYSDNDDYPPLQPKYERRPMPKPAELNSAFDALLATTPANPITPSSSQTSNYVNNDSDSDYSDWEKYYERDSGSGSEDEEVEQESDIKSLCEGKEGKAESGNDTNAQVKLEEKDDGERQTTQEECLCEVRQKDESTPSPKIDCSENVKLQPLDDEIHTEEKMTLESKEDGEKVGSQNTEESTVQSGNITVPVEDMDEPIEIVPEPSDDDNKSTRDTNKPVEDNNEPTKVNDKSTEDIGETVKHHCELPEHIDEPVKHHSPEHIDKSDKHNYESPEHINEPVKDHYEPSEHINEPDEDHYELTEHIDEPVKHLDKPIDHTSEPVEHYKSHDDIGKQIKHQYEPLEHIDKPDKQHEPPEHTGEPDEHMSEPVKHHHEPPADIVEQVEHHFGQPEHIGEPVEEPHEPREHAGEPVEKPHEPPEPVKEHYEPPESLEEPCESPEPVEEPCEPPESVEPPYKHPELIEEHYKPPEPVEEPYEQPEPVEDPYESPEPIEETVEHYESPEHSEPVEDHYEPPELIDEPAEDIEEPDKINYELSKDTDEQNDFTEPTEDIEESDDCTYDTDHIEEPEDSGESTSHFCKSAVDSNESTRDIDELTQNIDKLNQNISEFTQAVSAKLGGNDEATKDVRETVKRRGSTLERTERTIEAISNVSLHSHTKVESGSEGSEPVKTSEIATTSSSGMTYMLVAVDAHGNTVPTVPTPAISEGGNDLVAVEAAMEDGTTRTLYIDPSQLGPNVDLNNLMLHIDSSGQEHVIIPSSSSSDSETTCQELHLTETSGLHQNVTESSDVRAPYSSETHGYHQIDYEETVHTDHYTSTQPDEGESL